jgi:hypothetical protein
VALALDPLNEAARRNRSDFYVGRATMTARLPTWTSWSLPISCVYRKLKSDYNGDEVRQGWRVNE